MTYSWPSGWRYEIEYLELFYPPTLGVHIYSEDGFFVKRLPFPRNWGYIII